MAVSASGFDENRGEELTQDPIEQGADGGDDPSEAFADSPDAAGGGAQLSGAEVETEIEELSEENPKMGADFTPEGYGVQHQEPPRAPRPTSPG